MLDKQTNRTFFPVSRHCISRFPGQLNVTFDFILEIVFWLFSQNYISTFFSKFRLFSRNYILTFFSKLYFDFFLKISTFFSKLYFDFFLEIIFWLFFQNFDFFLEISTFFSKCVMKKKSSSSHFFFSWVALILFRTLEIHKSFSDMTMDIYAH